MLFQVLTHFPERYHFYLESGLPARAIKKQLFRVEPVCIRDFADDSRKGRVDASPYGGGPGMILQVAPIDRALQSLPESLPVVLFTPRGRRLKQEDVSRLAKNKKGYTLVCGYFEGVDERVAEHLVDYQVSLGDFILGSGDLPALCFIEAITRLLDGYTGSVESTVDESYTKGLDSVAGVNDAVRLLEYPQYTRPREYNGWKVPAVLLNGNHKEIESWRNEESVRQTKMRFESK